MTDCVVEVGPATIRGPCDVDPDLVSTTLECIDDAVALLDEQPVAVAALWRAVFRSVLPDSVDSVCVVCPSWWPAQRVERVQEAAMCRATNVVALQRAHVIANDTSGLVTVVEIALDIVVVWRAGRVVMVQPRLGQPADVARAVANGVDAAGTVLIDAPAGVDADGFTRALSECLRDDGLAATIVDQDRVLEGLRDSVTPWGRTRRPLRRRGPAVTMLGAAAAFVLLLCGGLAASYDLSKEKATGVPMTLLVEGRIAVKVPAQWAARRITSGEGSARVEVSAPDDAVAVLISQSPVRAGESLSATAATLRAALDDQQAGVFDRFNPDDRRADRPAATYREVRDGRQIDWAVFVDDAVRIAIGCQSRNGEEDAVRSACDEAIRSAHAVV